jgi:glutathionylspermidine synthase
MYDYQSFLTANPNYKFARAIEWHELGLGVSQLDFDKECADLTKFLEAQSLELINNTTEIKELSYPDNSLKYLDTNLSIMRLGFVVDTFKKPKLIEINSQTPSFWWECHDAQVDAFCSSPSNYKQILVRYLENAIKLVDIHLNRVTKPRVGLVCCDHPDDLFQMEYVQDLINSANAAGHVEVLTIEDIDINAREMVFSTKTNKELDALLFWYPIEWLAIEKFGDETNALEGIFDLVARKKLYIINGMQSFVVQNKEFLAKIWESEEKLHDMIIPSFYTKDELEAELGKVDFIAKPIFGREGQGVFGQKAGQSFEGDLSDSYYTDQNYIYQPLISSAQIRIDSIDYTYTLEKWVVKIDGIWYPAGQSLRLNNSTGIITNNESKWAPLT